jgi:alcohol dehydrogenase YqhD (iron-dependent ADH family)
VKPNSKVLCTFGFGSIDKNGARADTQSAFDNLQCEVRWEGRILANLEYDRLLEIAAVVHEFKPDLLLAVGGRSVVDGAKFISVAAAFPPSDDAWETIIGNHSFSSVPFMIGTAITHPATSSE